MLQNAQGLTTSLMMNFDFASQYSGSLCQKRESDV